MVVKTTKLLELTFEHEHFEHKHLDIQLFCDEFKLWKSKDEHSSSLFGKDSAYIAPTVNGEKYILRHVHLVPVIEQQQIDSWYQKLRFRSRKTSNRALVYVDDNKGNILLIYILPEPDAHEIAKMKTQKDKEIMNGFAAIAEAFIFDGSILG
jgi:mRNA interferase YafO